MPAPQKTDYFTQTVQRILALLTASVFLRGTDGTGKDGVIKTMYGYVSGQRWPEKPVTRGAADLPELVIDFDSCRILNPNIAPTFCNIRGTTGDRVIEQEVVFKFTLTSPALDMQLSNQVLTEIETVLMSDPRMGLAKVKSLGRMSARSKLTREAPAGGVRRRITDILFPVVFELHRADIF